MPKIIFQPQTKQEAVVFERPVPAQELIPDWYKNTPIRTFGDKRDGIAQDSTDSSNLSIKGCMPFLDALTTGYVFVSPADIEVRIVEDNFYLRWMVDLPPVSSHSAEQAGYLPKASSHELAPFRWNSGWIVKTPPGYSTMFTHPFNRNDLPFRTLTGIVETDKHPLATNFPFQILDQEEYPFIIKKGTPIAQVIPFKRENWTAKYEKENEEEYYRNSHMMKTKIARAYKSMFWTKKKYN